MSKPEKMLIRTNLAGDATVTISHRYTPKEQLKQHTILADIVVAAAGKTIKLFALKARFPQERNFLY